MHNTVNIYEAIYSARGVVAPAETESFSTFNARGGHTESYASYRPTPTETTVTARVESRASITSFWQNLLRVPTQEPACSEQLFG